MVSSHAPCVFGCKSVQNGKIRLKVLISYNDAGLEWYPLDNPVDIICVFIYYLL